MGKRESAKSFLEEALPDKTVKGIIEQAAPDNVVAKGLNLVGNVGEHILETPVGFFDRQLRKIGNWARSRNRGNL